MRHPEWFAKRVHLSPGSSSEYRSDGVVNHRAARHAPPPCSPRNTHPSLFVGRRSSTQLLRMKNIYGLFNYSYFTKLDSILEWFFSFVILNVNFKILKHTFPLNIFVSEFYIFVWKSTFFSFFLLHFIITFYTIYYKYTTLQILSKYVKIYVYTKIVVIIFIYL